MKRPANSCKSFSVLVLLGFLILGLAAKSYADSKPKYVYVTDSGQYTGEYYTGTGNVGATQQRFQFTATATCTNYACASPITISGSFAILFYLTFAGVRSAGIALSDSSDLAASPLALLNGYLSPSGAVLSFGPPAPASNVLLNFPFASGHFPTNYSGGMLCTVAFTTGCASPSTITIAAADQSPSLLAITGGLPLTATIQSGTVTLAASTQGSNSVSGYAVDGTTGALTLLPGSPFAAGSDPAGLAVNPSNKFVYVANHLSNNVSVFAVDISTGSLSQITGSPFAAGAGPSSIALDPTGNFVYVTNQGSNNISAYTTDSETGALTPMSGSPFSSDVSPIKLTMDPLGRFLYVTNSNLTAYPYPPTFSYSEVGYTIDHTAGALTRIPISLQGLAGPLGGAIDPLGQYYFDIGYFQEEWGVAPGAINPTTGVLTYSLNGSGEVLPGAVAVHPSGKFVYVTDVDFNYIAAFSFNSVTGAITPIPGSALDNYGSWDVPAGSYATGYAPLLIVADPSGKFVYVANEFSDDISGYSVNPTSGALTPIAGTPFAAGVGPSSLAIVSSSTVSFETFLAKAEIDEDRETSFRVEGFFSLGAGSNGIYPLSEPVQVQVGSLTLTIPAGSMRQREKQEFVYEGTINGTDLKMAILRWDGKGQGKGTLSNDYLFIVEGKGKILSGISNPVTVGLGIGDDEGSTAVIADIDK